ncbi:MAG: conjugal transfer protein, partial [Novosphingobium sp.]
MGVVGLAALSGCTTFGGNVKGNFSCSAPDGICAPSSSIDDRALAMIAD